MKTYSIGREHGCDIVIDDSTDIVSRRHAILNVTSSGKMTIIDQSSNGTYVNGIRISPNVPVPVTRKDTISFAHIAKLDWRLVPKSTSWMIYTLIGFIALIVVACIVFGVMKYTEKDSSANNPNQEQIQELDSLRKVQETIRKDSIEKAKKDSIAQKERNDSIEKAKKAQKKVEKKKGKDKDKEKEKAQDGEKEKKENKEKKQQNVKRTVG
jgi:pSer/pThr/pTyr-binding forkhead associated (FHA) protein